MTLFVELTEDEEVLADSYASSLRISKEEAFRRAFFERIEDEYDIAAGEAAYIEYLKNPVTYTLEDLMAEDAD